MRIDETSSINLSGLSAGDVVLIEKDLRPGSPADRLQAVYVGEEPVSVTLLQGGKYHEVPYVFLNKNDVEGSLGEGVIHIADYIKTELHANEPKRTVSQMTRMDLILIEMQ